MARTLKPTPYHIEAEAARAKAEAAAAKAKADAAAAELDEKKKRKAELDEKKKQARKQRKTEADEKKKHDPRANHALQEATTAWLMDASRILPSARPTAPSQPACSFSNWLRRPATCCLPDHGR